MRSLFMLIAAFLAVQGRQTLDNYTFEQYLQEFHLSYPESELSSRRAIFDSEISRIKAHNTKNVAWKEDVNRFMTMTPAEKKASFGRAKSLGKNQRKFLKSSQQELPADFKLRAVSELPTSVDWRTQGIVSVVKDQGHCGSCWAFAATATIESHVAKASGLLFDLSVQQVASCTPNPNQCGGTGGCNGATAELAFQYASDARGLFQEYQWGYNSYMGQNQDCKLPGVTKPVASVNGFVQLPINNYTALMNAVATVGPVAISVDASTWHSYSSGIFDGCNQVNPDINHGVVLVGYGQETNGDKYWIVRNSWSATWGEKGFIRLARHDDEDSRCGSDVTPQDGVACAGENDPVQVCGTCGIVYDTAYPLNANAL